MKHARIAFAVLLFLSALTTAGLGVMTVLAPERMAEGFGIVWTGDPGVALLTAVLGGVLVSLSLFVFLAAWWSWHSKQEGRTLGLISAATLLLVAVVAFAVGGSVQVLLLDGIRGTVLLLLGWLWRPSR